MVLRKTVGLIGSGVVVGVLATVMSTRVLVTQLWGVTPNDPATVVTVIAVILAAGLLAGFVPARRATRIDPIAAMRSE